MLLALTTAAAFAQAASPRPTSSAAELLQQHENARRAHLNGDAALLASGAAGTVLDLHDGEISRLTRDQLRQRFQQYFAAVKYQEWSDVEPPVVRVSSDGRMGWMAVKIKARLTRKVDKGEERVAFVSSWIATYEKQRDGWKMVAVSSAVKEQPPEP